MTEYKNSKSLARKLAAREGISYTAARRRLLERTAPSCVVATYAVPRYPRGARCRLSRWQCGLHGVVDVVAEQALTLFSAHERSLGCSAVGAPGGPDLLLFAADFGKFAAFSG